MRKPRFILLRAVLTVAAALSLPLTAPRAQAPGTGNVTVVPIQVTGDDAARTSTST